MASLHKELFNFVDDVDLRDRCSKDFNELNECIKNRTWKASIILIGSLIEAVLYWYIHNNEFICQKIPNISTKRVTLSDLLNWSRQYGIIDDGLFRLSDQLRDYRNLIHSRLHVARKVELNENLVQIGYNVLLEVIRCIKSHSNQSSDAQAITLLKEFIRSRFSRQPTRAELAVYLPIIQKYGKARGLKIIERSVNYSVKN